MKKLFTLIAFLAVFMGAKAETLVDAEVDFSTMTSIDDLRNLHFGWVGSESAFARLSIQDGCLHFESTEATDPSWDCQFFPIGGVDAEVGVTYTLHYKVKGSVAQNCNMGGFGQNGWGWFPITTDWVEGTLDYECTEANGNLLMQCGDYVGTWDIAYLKVTHEGKAPTPITWKNIIENGDAEKSWEDLGLADVAYNDMDNNMKVCFWTKEKGVNDHNPHPAEIITENNGNHAFICRATTADTEGNESAWDNQIWLQSPRAWKTGEQFKVTFRYKASEPVVTNTQLHKQTPSDYLHYIGVGDVSFTTEWQDFEQVVTVPSDGNGMWSIAFNLNPNVKTPVDFYIDDITWSEMVLDHGYFITATNTETGNVDYDFEGATELTYDDDEALYVATVGTVGNSDSWVNEVMISTVRGNDRQFKANTLKTVGAVLGNGIGADVDNWNDVEESPSAKIALPAQGVWKVWLDTDYNQIAFIELDGEEIQEPEEIVENPSEIVIVTVDRAMTEAEGKAAGYAEGSEELAACTGQPWDNQFFLIANRDLAVGDEVFISFDYMATTPTTVGTQNSRDAGNYLHWAGLGNIDFTTEWQHFEATVKIPKETTVDGNGNPQGPQNSWTFNLANDRAANEFHFKNIIFCNADKTRSYIDMVTENEANFMCKIGANTTPGGTAGVVEINTNKVASNVIYNIAGQRVAKNYKGIVIKNGSKYIVK